MEKRCSTCKAVKDINLFYKNRANKDGYSGKCQVCNNALVLAWQRDNPGYRGNNKPKRRAKDGKKECSRCGETKEVLYFFKQKQAKDGYSPWCKVCSKEASKKSRTINPFNARLRVRKWVKDNPERHKLNGKKWIAANKDTNTNFKLSRNLRTRIRKALAGRNKCGSAVKDLGCSIDEFCHHIQSLFTEGMDWANYGFGSDKWHIDHIMPLAAFDLEDPQHFLLASHYLNLRPLWQRDNLQKNCKIPYDLLTIS